MPDITGRVDRRILLNYRVDPDVAATLVPEPFRPRLVGGHAMAGVCLIRLSALRPVGVPAALGITTENAAHRIAVEWDDADGGLRTGVFIRRRDTSSRLTALVGGRLFPGYHHHAQVVAHGLDVCFTTEEGTHDVRVEAQESPRLPADSVFATLDEAAAFFCGAKVAYAVTRDPTRVDGLEVEGEEWHARALDVHAAHAAFYDALPSASFDSAIVMRCERSRWRPRPSMTVQARHRRTPGPTPARPAPAAPGKG